MQAHAIYCVPGAMREIVFDTETTGFDPGSGDRIVEIGGVELRHGMLTDRRFHCYVNPERDMPRAAFEVHGLSAEFLSDKPVFAAPEAGPAFMEFVGDAKLVAHNAGFDMKFLNFELERAGLPVVASERVVDTLEIARRKFPGGSNSLDALCRRFNISLDGRDKHGALIDSELLAYVYIELTGGAQRRLGLFAEGGAASAADGSPMSRKPAPPRPAPLASLITEDERAAHANFVTELGEAALWTKFS